MGAGLAGAVAALLLRERKYEVVVIERRTRESQGSHVVGINLDVRTLVLLRRLGFSLEDLQQCGTFLDQASLYVVPQKDALKETVRMIDAKKIPCKTSGLQLHRLHLHLELLNMNTNVWVLVLIGDKLLAEIFNRAEKIGVQFRFNVAVDRVDLSDGVVVLASGESISGDMIIAADGLHRYLLDIIK